MLKQGTCPITGKRELLIFSNNPIAAPVSVSYIEKTIDLKDLEKADFFCRTYNIPFNPDMWIRSIEVEKGKNIIQNYTKYFLSVNKENLYYETATRDIWKIANKEWQKSITHADLLRKIEPIKDDFISRSKMTWGALFSFEEFIKMENQYQTTVTSFEVSNPMQLDAIRKACITSVMIDRVMLGDGDIKSLKDLSTALAAFMKMAKIDELIESSQTEVIRTVADLANHLESNGFKFVFYDKVERDVVDKTINNLKEYNRNLVLESTGLESTLELINSKYQQGLKSAAAEDAYNEISLEELTKIAKEEMQTGIDNELETQDIIEDEEDLDDVDILGDYNDEDF